MLACIGAGKDEGRTDDTLVLALLFKRTSPTRLVDLHTLFINQIITTYTSNVCIPRTASISATFPVDVNGSATQTRRTNVT